MQVKNDRAKVWWPWILGMASLLGASPVRGAEFSLADHHYVSETLTSATVKVEGKIVSGDYLRLWKLLSAFPGFEHGFWDDSTVLSLNSPGGDFPEGLRIGSLIRQKGVGTRVPEGAECYSSCALIFMHGTVSADGESYLNRKLHPSGRLGFHAPYLVLRDDTAISREMVAASYAVALQDVASLIESAGTIFSEELLMKMLRVGPNDLLMVDTYGDLLTWDIVLDGPVTKMHSLTLAQILMACETFDDLQSDRRPDITLVEAQGYVDQGHGPLLLGTVENGDAIYSHNLNDMDGIGCNVGIGRNDDGSLHARYYGDSYWNKQAETPLQQISRPHSTRATSRIPTRLFTPPSVDGP